VRDNRGPDRKKKICYKTGGGNHPEANQIDRTLSEKAAFIKKSGGAQIGEKKKDGITAPIGQKKRGACHQVPLLCHINREPKRRREA